MSMEYPIEPMKLSKKGGAEIEKRPGKNSTRRESPRIGIRGQ